MLKNLKIYVSELVQQPDGTVSKTSSLASEKFSSLKRNDPRAKDLVQADSLPSFGDTSMFKQVNVFLRRIIRQDILVFILLHKFMA